MRTTKRRKKRPATTPFPLREILGRLGLSQYRAAQMSGLSQQAISHLCTGRKAPSWKTLLRVMVSIGADLGDLAPRGGAA
jgi:transcriptional regulator with XRE-family HTH domain